MTNSGYQVSVIDADAPGRNVAVLRISSAAQNSVIQFYRRRVQINIRHIESLHKKVVAKLALHQIQDVRLSLTLQLADDRSMSFTSINTFLSHDLSIEALTSVVTMKWAFVFVDEDGREQHMHSIYVRVAAKANPNLVFQKMLSNHNEDVEEFDQGAFAPVVCKLDFVDSRFSTEALALITEWVQACPVAEPTFRIFKRIERNEDRLLGFIYTTFPAVAVLAYIGLWLAYLSPETTSSVRIATAWILGGGIVFVLSRYAAGVFNEIVSRLVGKICNVPVFQITAGDNNRMTSYLAQSHKSMIKLAAGGTLYGIAKGIGLYLASSVLGG